jgi:hypothetical protein
MKQGTHRAVDSAVEQRSACEAMKRTASCSCGDFSITAEGDPVRISVCHCHACQRRTGSAFGVQARFPAERITRIKGDGTAYERVGDSGNTITFYFCARCGSTVFYKIAALPDVVAIPVGGFAEASFPEPRVAVYEARKHPWVELPGIVEHHD